MKYSFDIYCRIIDGKDSFGRVFKIDVIQDTN